MKHPDGIQAPDKWMDLDQPQRELTEPFTHPVTVSWGDCDPAQIAYTANIPGWGLLAIEAWYKACLGKNWFELNLHCGVGTPFVSLNFDFTSPVRPIHPLVIHVSISRLGSSSLSHAVRGYQDHTLCFTGKTTAAFVDATQLRTIPIPGNMRKSVEHYISIQDQPEPL